MMFDEFIRKESITVNNVDIEVHTISAKERQNFSQFIQETPGKALTHAAWLVKYGTEKYKGMEVDALLDMPDYALLQISEAVIKVSGIGKKPKAGAE